MAILQGRTIPDLLFLSSSTYIRIGWATDMDLQCGSTVICRADRYVVVIKLIL